ncbi:uncharacterized protein [Arachis hypogaea]|uniref:uncharacterized protein isoform X1 n=1 Tax=Arachis hypogaea TaxID=3818 RepID=UPI003B2258D5
MREEVLSPNASQPLEELRSSSSPRRGKRSCSRRTSHCRASWLPMKEPREPLPSRRRGTRERGAVSVVAVTAVDSQEIQGNPSSGLILFWFSCKGNWCTSRSKGQTLRNGGLFRPDETNALQGKLDETNALLVKERENVEKVTIEATPVIQEKEIIVEDTAKIDALTVEVERLNGPRIWMVKNLKMHHFYFL